MELYAGLDLHSSNTYIGIMDGTFNRVFKKRVSNDLEQILQILKPFKKRLKGFVVESTYNWYWLVDGLMDAGYHQRSGPLSRGVYFALVWDCSGDPSVVVVKIPIAWLAHRCTPYKIDSGECPLFVLPLS